MRRRWRASSRPPRVVPAEPGSPLISLERIGKSYPGTQPVHALAGVDLLVQPGEYLAVTGASGSGKSTLLNVLGLLDDPTGGTYRLDGHDTAALSEMARTALRARSIGFVFQDFHLMAHRTLWENVALGQLYTGSSAATRYHHARDVLARVGLGDRLDALPTQLSGGERQRVAIARAVVNAPRLLLCDEPTGNLDSHTAAGVLDLVEELHDDGVTVLVITHDQRTAERAPRQLTIHDGHLVADTDRTPCRSSS